ncbi:hypothetical protein [Pelagimonas varians]|uniref:Uncharacterized protein n=1 Tax=Pelagimonas varians TaxID=696760 RepID=A0A238KTN5_9RHOB|nr:hypothetical protein [Pelagimonas varians]PYG32591.1 hypothetical protein C8N36_103340 [Pelagimonas varians]SMX46068.1 hypothetical protein PEV8663_03184 [Pelagimonas varians]
MSLYFLGSGEGMTRIGEEHHQEDRIVFLRAAFEDTLTFTGNPSCRV